MNTQKKRGPLEVSDERFEKTPWTSLTPQGAPQERVGMTLWMFFWRYRENGQNRKGKTVGHVFDRDRLGCR